MFRVVLLAVFGAFAVAGVMVFAMFVGKDEGGSLGTVRIWGTIDDAAFGEVLTKSLENGGPLSGVVYEKKDPATYEKALTNALANGEGPDLFILRENQVFRNLGKIYVLPPETHPLSKFESTFVDVVSPFTNDKGIAGIPILVDPLVLYWNKDMLATAGYAKPPSFWDELIGMAQKITVKDETGTIKRSAIAMGEYRNVTNAKEILATLILQAGGRITAFDEQRALRAALAPQSGSESQAAVSALRFYTEFANPSKEIYTWNRSLLESQRAFAGGDVALYIGYASEESAIRRTNANLNYGVAPLPQIRSNSTSLNTARVYGIAVSRTSTNLQGAVTAATLLAGADFAGPLAQGLGMTSARRELLSTPGTGNADIFNKQTIIARSWTDPDPEATAEIFRAMIENTTSGAVLINEAVQRADLELTQILAI